MIKWHYFRNAWNPKSKSYLPNTTNTNRCRCCCNNPRHHSCTFGCSWNHRRTGHQASFRLRYKALCTHIAGWRERAINEFVYDKYQPYHLTNVLRSISCNPRSHCRSSPRRRSGTFGCCSRHHSRRHRSSLGLRRRALCIHIPTKKTMITYIEVYDLAIDIRALTVQYFL